MSSLVTQFYFFGLAVWPVRSYSPDQGSNPCPPDWECRVLTTGSPGKSKLLYFSPFLLFSFSIFLSLIKCHLFPRHWT